MNLDHIKINNAYASMQSEKEHVNSYVSKASLSFKGAREELGAITLDALEKASAKYKEELAGTVVKKTNGGLSQIFQRVRSFIDKNFISGTDVTYDTVNSISNSPVSDFIHKTFGTVRGKKQKFILIADENTDTITIHKEPFIKNVCEGIKEFTVGTVLDICTAGRSLIRRIDAKFGTSDIITNSKRSTSLFNRILDNRITEKEARDSFYKISNMVI